MNLKGLREFLSYTKDQRRGVYVLLLLLIILITLLYFDGVFYPNTDWDQAQYQKAKAQWKQLNQQEEEALAQALVPFNPNTCSLKQWRAMGFSGSLADRIGRYREKGGRFYEPQDLFKIYGIDSALVQQVIPYVQIPEKDKAPSAPEPPTLRLDTFDPNTVAVAHLKAMGLKSWQAQNFENFRTKYRPFKKDSDVFKVYGIDSALAKQLLPFVKPSAPEPNKAAEPTVVIEINKADSLDLLQVKGIGPFTAHKLLERRKALGGFYALEQLQGQYPIDSARYAQIAPQLSCNGEVKQLNINTASFKELVNHPLLNYNMVKGIAHFRENIRPFKSVKELQKIELFGEEIFAKIAPYLTVATVEE